MAGREQGAGPGLPGGPAPGGPDGRVQALLAERPVDDGEGRAGPAVPVRPGDQPGRPAEQPRLDLRGDQERDRPRPVGRRVGRGPVGNPARKLDGELDGVEEAHAGPLGGRPALAGSCGSHEDAGRRAGLGTGPGGRLASAGGSRAPGPGTRAGPLQPRGEAGVAVQGALGGVPVRHGKARGCRFRPRLSSLTRPSGRLYRIATIPCCCGCRIDPVDWGVSNTVWPPLVPTSPEHRSAGTRQAPGPSRSQALPFSRPYVKGARQL